MTFWIITYLLGCQVIVASFPTREACEKFKAHEVTATQCVEMK